MWQIVIVNILQLLFCRQMGLASSLKFRQLCPHKFSWYTFVGAAKVLAKRVTNIP